MLKASDYTPENTLLWLQHLDIFGDVPADELRTGWRGSSGSAPMSGAVSKATGL